MSSRQFTILLSLCIVSLCTVLYLVFTPSPQCQHTGQVEHIGQVEHGGALSKDFSTGRIIVIVKKDIAMNGGQGLPDSNAFVEYFGADNVHRYGITLHDGSVIFDQARTGHYMLRITSGFFQKQFVGFLSDSSRIKTDTVKF